MTRTCAPIALGGRLRWNFARTVPLLGVKGERRKGRGEVVLISQISREWD